jgi:putative membrane protein
VGAVLRIVIYAAALWVAVALIDGLRFDGEVLALLAIALVLGVVNVIVKPILTVLSLPLVLLTLGFFLLVVNAISLAIVIAISGALNLGLESDGFGSTFLGAIVISLVAWGLETLTGVRR